MNQVQPFKKGTLLKVVHNCFCEHYLHEVSSHWRPGLIQKKLNKDDVVEFMHVWSNLVGGPYCRVKKDGIEYDILPRYLIKL